MKILIGKPDRLAQQISWYVCQREFH